MRRTQSIQRFFFFGIFLLPLSGLAAEKAPFYQGKTLNFVINFAGGGIKYEALKAANMSSTNLQRLILLPPGAPTEATTVLRQAFSSLSKDSDFIANALKTIRFHPTFEVGEQGERLFQQVSQTAPDVIAFIRQYIEQANR
jgi:hypothetical protein